MLRRLRERTQNEQGFTLIELLVVILIIGILAAIAIPSFLNQRGKGNDAEAKSTVVTAAEAMETCATDNNGSYSPANCIKGVVGPPATGLIAIEPTLSDAGARLEVDPNTDSYKIAVASKREVVDNPTFVANAFVAPTSGVQFRLSRASTGATTRTCVVITGSNGGCNGGSW